MSPKNSIIAIEDARRYIERVYIGFSPSTTPKPVHLANGLFRTVMHKVADTTLLNRFVFVQTVKGVEPPKHKLEEVFSTLQSQQRIDGAYVSRESISKLRRMLNKVVNADRAVFTGGMESYTSGFSAFMSKDRVGQDGGELVAEWLRQIKSPLHSSIIRALEQEEDPISLMCSPLLNPQMDDYSPPLDINQVGFMNTPQTAISSKLWDGLAQAATSLSIHLDAHPNKLFRLRLSVLFTSFALIKHLFSLEEQYIASSHSVIRPFLLDFSSRKDTSAGRASAMTYITACQSVSRFYSWAFGQYLKTIRSEDELRKEPVPLYKGRTIENGKTTAERKAIAEAEEIWRQAQLTEQRDDQDFFSVCGQALYDMMAVQAVASPIDFASKLGCGVGLLDPPNMASKRFSIHQDLLEMLVRGSVSQGEVIDMPGLQARLLERFGVIIGGRVSDEQMLMQSGIFEADFDSLEENRAGFAAALKQLNFARLLADGVLQVDLGGSYAN